MKELSLCLVLSSHVTTLVEVLLPSQSHVLGLVVALIRRGCPMGLIVTDLLRHLGLMVVLFHAGHSRQLKSEGTPNHFVVLYAVASVALTDFNMSLNKATQDEILTSLEGTHLN